MEFCKGTSGVGIMATVNIIAAANGVLIGLTFQRRKVIKQLITENKKAGIKPAF